MSCRIATSSSSNTASAASSSSSPTAWQSTASRLECSAVPVWWWRSASTSSPTASSIASRAAGSDALAAAERSRSVASWGPVSVMNEAYCPRGARHAHGAAPPRQDTDRLRLQPPARRALNATS